MAVATMTYHQTGDIFPSFIPSDDWEHRKIYTVDGKETGRYYAVECREPDSPSLTETEKSQCSAEDDPEAEGVYICGLIIQYARETYKRELLCDDVDFIIGQGPYESMPRQTVDEYCEYLNGIEGFGNKIPVYTDAELEALIATEEEWQKEAVEEIFISPKPEIVEELPIYESERLGEVISQDYVWLATRIITTEDIGSDALTVPVRGEVEKVAYCSTAVAGETVVFRKLGEKLDKKVSSAKHSIAKVKALAKRALRKMSM